MPNMSYCRFENTYRDLLDCYHTIQEAYSIEEMDLSTSERAYLIRLISLAQNIIEAAGEFPELKEEAAHDVW